MVFLLIVIITTFLYRSQDVETFKFYLKETEKVILFIHYIYNL
jgi:hypothetical protein